jgi:hypothetical protein
MINDNTLVELLDDVAFIKGKVNSSILELEEIKRNLDLLERKLNGSAYKKVGK